MVLLSAIEDRGGGDFPVAAAGTNSFLPKLRLDGLKELLFSGILSQESHAWHGSMICLAGALALMVCQAMAVPLLLVIPPLTQLNTPYPSTAYLTGFLRSRGYEVSQADVGIDMVLALFSRDGLTRAFEEIRSLPGELPGEARQMLALQRHYLDSIDPVV